ncbi:MAG: 5-aminoimidazole-4-carboxamide ribonucleotide transformylase [Chloroflexi bacterium]|nr:5-aminoimidazole-4-carboxamide ribonucleotide transformylase [Chloroflexota bacterium]|tara:strand:+ start:5408 stop:6583 length:1176 start_codon:yes stop_codon:yes gene_type:complete
MENNEIVLRYGMNPHQTPASAFVDEGSLPFQVKNGSPGFINLLDALNSWQLVKDLNDATGMPAAASFKHVSPAGAAISTPLSDELTRAYFVDNIELSPLATAYARARGADRVSSFGDWIALSQTVDESTANLIRREVSDGVIAPGFTEKAMEILSQKQNGRYCMLEVDKSYSPDTEETRTIFGVHLRQGRNITKNWQEQINNVVTAKKDIPDSARRDMLVALIALKYTQSNSICFAYDGQVIGNGAGQQSRIHCTRLAGNKADIWYLRQHPNTLNLDFRDKLGRPEKDNAIDGFLRDDLSPEEDSIWRQSFHEVPTRLPREMKRQWLDTLSGVSMASDAFIPFRDNIDRASMSGVQYVVQPGGSVRDEDVVKACDAYGMIMSLSGTRLFHH